MELAEIRTVWERTAPGWARWEPMIANWMGPATEAMLSMAGVKAGARVLDIACGAGSQTLLSAERVGPKGKVVASDISDRMLHHVKENARAAGLNNVTTMAGAAEDLALEPESFDAVICRIALMLFTEPKKALESALRALRPGGKAAAVVFTTPAANSHMSKPMQILLRHAGKSPPAAGQPGIFALGAPGLIERLFADSGFVEIEKRVIRVAFRMESAAQALTLMQEAFGAYRAVLEDCNEAVRDAAWAEVAETLGAFETATGFEAPGELLVVAGAKPA